MITRAAGSDPATAQVRFALPVTAYEGQSISVVGDFNGWDPDANPLQREAAELTVTVVLPTGGTHRFRYLGSETGWFNDEAADDYLPNEHGGQDGVLDLAALTVASYPQRPSKPRGGPRRMIPGPVLLVEI